MLKRLRLRRTDEGQGLVLVIAVVAVAAIVLGALEISVIGDAQLAASSTSQEQSLQAAETGLADYQTNVNGSASQWQYAMSYCSSGTFGCNINGTVANPDPGNAAFSGIPDPHCATSAYNATAGTPGSANYYGWVTVHGSSSGGFSEQFQYIVDASLAKPLGGYVHIFVTGRAGSSGHYSCSTIKALYNGPQLTSVNTVQLSPASCSGSTIPVPAPAAGTNIARVLIEATGGSGQTGGSSGLSAGGGVGGTGETVEATYAASDTSTLYVNLGCQGGSNTSIVQGGPGFASGGSLPGSGNAGGGGGATAVCAVSPCTSSTITSGNLANDLYLVAGGGGGGGEGIFGATAAGGKGGSGVTTTVTSGVAENGSTGANATAWFNINGGVGGAGGKGSSGYVPGGGAGTHANGWFDADGGGGGAGYNGGSGGQVGFGGGGGGAGASFYNTNTSPSAGGIGAYVPAATGTGFVGTGTTMSTTPASYGSVIIQWEDSTGAPVGTPVVPASCGPYAERTTQIPALSDVSLQVSGGSGGNGDDLSIFGFWSDAGVQGVGSTVVATYQNTSTLPVDVTAIQGCQGAIGGDDGVTPGGDGLETANANPATSGGDNCSGCTGNQGDSGSAGGASAICVGTIPPGSDTPTNNNCTVGGGSASDLLMVAGGGGGGGGVSSGVIGLCNGGNGGAAGTATASDWPASTTLTTGGVAGSNGGAPNGFACASYTVGAGGSASTSAYAPTGANGNSTSTDCSGDGGGGGGGMVGAGAGSYSTGYFPGFCIVGGAGAGGGGGSSYLAPTNGNLTLQQCPSGSQCLYSPCPSSGQSNPATNQINTSSGAVDEGEWCAGQENTNGAASITDTAVPNSSGVLSQSPTSVPSTPASVIW
jgi:hypothetical protein